LIFFIILFYILLYFWLFEEIRSKSPGCNASDHDQMGSKNDLDDFNMKEN